MEPGEAAEPLYGHCMRAIRSAARFGPHGLPYMEGGDWNDGMDQVGQGGGESVWLGWFLLAVYRRFAPIARAYGREADAEALEGAIPGLRRHWKPPGTGPGTGGRILPMARPWALPPTIAAGSIASPRHGRLSAGERMGRRPWTP